MPSIRVTAFAGLMPERQAKLLDKSNAQVAHNCLLWDGTLRPMPEFVVYRQLPNTVYGLTTVGDDGSITYSYDMVDIAFNSLPPIARGTFGIRTSAFSNGRNLGILMPGDSGPRPLSIDAPLVVFEAHSTQRTYRSDCPRMVSYAVTGVRTNGDESAPVLLFSVGDDGTYFEGDAVRLDVTFDLAWLTDNNILKINIYKTISNISSGEQAANPLDTAWHYVNDFGAAYIIALNGDMSFSDDGLTYRQGMDLLPSKEFYTELSQETYYIAPLDGGWLAVSGYNSVQFSERYLWHAYPVRNLVTLFGFVTGLAAKYDVVYVGTTMYPYAIKVTPGEGSNLTFDVQPYPEPHYCIQGTMVATGNGAMYASPEGLVALSPGSMVLASKDILNPGDVLYRDCSEDFDLTIRETDGAEWVFGRYFGYTRSDGLAYWFDPGDSINGAHPLQQFVTMDVPEQIHATTTSPNYGLVLAAASVIYVLPLPGFRYLTEYKDAPKKRYRWKSKRFVTPGHTAFSAMKVVRECGGDVCVTIWANCKRILTYPVDDAQPFRLPDAVQGTEFEFELEGTATVTEVHIATSVRELTENG